MDTKKLALAAAGTLAGALTARVAYLLLWDGFPLTRAESRYFFSLIASPRPEDVARARRAVHPLRRRQLERQARRSAARYRRAPAPLLGGEWA